MNKFISSLLVLVSLVFLASCSQSTEVTTTLETTTVPTTTTTEATTTTTTTEATTNYNDYLEEQLDLSGVEYQTYEIPYQFVDFNDPDFGMNTAMVNSNFIYDTQFFYSQFGYDNLTLRNNLINDAYRVTGEYNPDITIDNYRYFMFYDNALYQITDELLYTCASDERYSNIIQVTRAICSELGLRYLIDEIPSSYFYERFPEFMRIIDDGQAVELWEIAFAKNYLYGDTVDEECEQYEFERDLREFVLCWQYNTIRSGLIYGYNGDDHDYTNDVRQVRDLRNNRHVLVPTDEQYNEIMERLHECPTFENIDIYQVETRQEYFDAFGVYPEDVLLEERYDLNYEPYVSPYEFDVVQIDENIELQEY